MPAGAGRLPLRGRRKERHKVQSAKKSTGTVRCPSGVWEFRMGRNTREGAFLGSGLRELGCRSSPKSCSDRWCEFAPFGVRPARAGAPAPDLRPRADLVTSVRRLQNARIAGEPTVTQTFA